MFAGSDNSDSMLVLFRLLGDIIDAPLQLNKFYYYVPIAIRKPLISPGYKGKNVGPSFTKLIS